MILYTEFTLINLLIQVAYIFLTTAFSSTQVFKSNPYRFFLKCLTFQKSMLKVELNGKRI